MRKLRWALAVMSVFLAACGDGPLGVDEEIPNINGVWVAETDLSVTKNTCDIWQSRTKIDAAGKTINLWQDPKDRKRIYFGNTTPLEGTLNKDGTFKTQDKVTQEEWREFPGGNTKMRLWHEGRFFFSANRLDMNTIMAITPPGEAECEIRLNLKANRTAELGG